MTTATASALLLLPSYNRLRFTVLRERVRRRLRCPMAPSAATRASVVMVDATHIVNALAYCRAYAMTRNSRATAAVAPISTRRSASHMDGPGND